MAGWIEDPSSLNMGPPVSAMSASACRAHTCTCGDAASLESARRIETDVCRCCEEPMPPTYLRGGGGGEGWGAKYRQTDLVDT